MYFLWIKIFRYLGKYSLGLLRGKFRTYPPVSFWNAAVET